MRVPVLVAGAGPVGLCVTGDLARRGIDVLQVERGDGAVVQPKMDMPHPRTMEFCRRWGLVEAVENAGYNRAHPQDNVWVTAMRGGYELGREVFASCADEPYPPQSPQRRERCPQNFFDPVLARWVRGLPRAEQRYETELVDFAQDDKGVRAVIRDVTSGREDTVEADYLIGCDGAGSVVREKLGVGMTGNPVLTYTTNVIFRSRDLARRQDIATAYRYIFIAREGTWATLVAIDGYDTYRFSLVGGAAREKHTDDYLRAAILKAIGCDCDVEILSTMPWTRRELVADSFGAGRVHLVGDAAHQLSPTGAFGMNTGIQEAVDIAWKVEAMLRGWGGPRLLKSYEIERKPVAARNVREAAANLARMLETRARLPPSSIFEPGPEGDAARADYGAWYTERMSHEWFTIGVQLGYRYDGSPICVPDDTIAPPMQVATYVQTSHAGARAPHVWLADGRSTLDLFGEGFTLMRLGADAANPEPLVMAARARGVPLSVFETREPEVVAAYERALVLVRPDGHVAWRGDAPPLDALALIDVVRGA